MTVTARQYVDWTIDAHTRRVRVHPPDVISDEVRDVLAETVAAYLALPEHERPFLNPVPMLRFWHPEPGMSRRLRRACEQTADCPAATARFFALHLRERLQERLWVARVPAAWDQMVAAAEQYATWETRVEAQLAFDQYDWHPLLPDATGREQWFQVHMHTTWQLQAEQARTGDVSVIDRYTRGDWVQFTDRFAHLSPGDQDTLYVFVVTDGMDLETAFASVDALR